MYASLRTSEPIGELATPFDSPEPIGYLATPTKQRPEPIGEEVATPPKLDSPDSPEPIGEELATPPKISPVPRKDFQSIFPKCLQYYLQACFLMGCLSTG